MNRKRILDQKFNEMFYGQVKNEIYEKTDLSLKDINAFLSFLSNSWEKAYVTLILSSGMTRGQALNLQVKDLVEACMEELVFLIREDTDILTTLLSLNPKNIIPRWNITAGRNKKITFSSAESTFYLFLYLKERQLEKPISLDEPLFVTNNSAIASKQINDIFLNFNNIRSINSDYENFSFSSTTLRDYFKLTCDKLLPSFIDNKKDLEHYAQRNKHNAKRNKLYKLFVDGLPEEDKYFIEFASDKRQLKKYYQGIEKYLTVKNYNEKDIDIPKESIELRLFDSYAFKEKLKPRELNKLIEDFLDKFDYYLKYIDDGEDQILHCFKSNLQRENNDLNVDIMYDYTLHQIFLGCMLKYDIQSDDYFKRIYVRKNSWIMTEKTVVSHLENQGIFKKYYMNKELFEQVLANYLKELTEDQEEHYLTKKIITKLLLDSVYLDIPNPDDLLIINLDF